MLITKDLTIHVINKLERYGFLKEKYNFSDINLRITNIEQVDNLCKLLTFKELEKDELNTVNKILEYYFKEIKHRNLWKCGCMFTEMLDYIPSNDILTNIIKNNPYIYNYIDENELSFKMVRHNEFLDNLYNCYIIEKFNRLEVPEELVPYYNKVLNTKVLTKKEEIIVLEKYLETKDNKYYDMLMASYQRVLIFGVLRYQEEYNISYEEAISTGEKVLSSIIKSLAKDSRTIYSQLESNLKLAFYRKEKRLTLDLVKKQC